MGYEKYLDTVKKHCKTFSVSVPLVLAVCEQESAWNPSAVSGCGARGLMQIMPETGADIARWLKEKMGNLADPETNIKYGTYYLSILLKEFSESLAIAAYNAGPGAVMGYNGIPPYAETQNYVSSVLKRKAKYYQILQDLQKEGAPVKDYKVSPHFMRSEAECHCCNKVGPYAQNLKEELERLEALRALINRPINTNCLYRCPVHNAAVGGAKNSWHMKAAAADIWVEGMSVDELAEAAKKVGFNSIGRYYASQFVHVGIGNEGDFIGDGSRPAANSKEVIIKKELAKAAVPVKKEIAITKGSDTMNNIINNPAVKAAAKRIAKFLLIGLVSGLIAVVSMITANPHSVCPVDYLIPLITAATGAILAGLEKYLTELKKDDINKMQFGV